MTRVKYYILAFLNIVLFFLCLLPCFTIFYSDFVLGNEAYMVVRYLVLTALFLSILIVIFESVSLSFDKTASLNTLMIAIFLFVYLMTSRDMFTMVSTYVSSLEYYFWIRIIHSVAFYLAVYYFFQFQIHDYYAEIKSTRIYKYILLVVSLAADIVTLFVGFQWLSVFVICVLLFILHAVISARVVGKMDVTYIIATFMFVLLLGTHCANAISSSIKGLDYSHGLQAACILVIYLLFVAIYLVFIIKNLKKAYKHDEYEKKLKELQSTILIEQINPHFIFNSLNLIKANYHQTIDDGDRAVDLFSKHLRINVDVKGKKLLVPLEKELENVECFIELACMQLKRKINVVYNIDAYDFEVPILSIEPFIENAIKYSQIQDKDDGYIEIATTQDDNSFNIVISENGVGFDVQRISEKSTGMKNAFERLKILLNATANVSSEINIGTKIEIKIPKR